MNMSRLLGSMKLKIREIVLIEQRPFYYADVRVEVGGKKYGMKHGTFRNNISKLRKAGKVEPAFKFRPVFYTIQGKKFPKSMTQDRMVSTVIDDSILRQTPLLDGLKTVLKKNMHFTILD